jgi:hypothetical protein
VHLSRRKKWNWREKGRKKKESREDVKFIESQVEWIYSLVIQYVDGFQMLFTSYMGHRYFT